MRSDTTPHERHLVPVAGTGGDAIGAAHDVPLIAARDGLLGSARPVLLHVIGTRPDVVRLASVVSAVEARNAFRQVVVHTGQHYDPPLAADLIAELGLPEPERTLAVGSDSHAAQTARVLVAMEQVLLDLRPAAVVVSGDSNSTLGASLAAAKVGIPVIHVEAGLRSNDWTEAEEVNRVLTDQIADLLLVSSAEAAARLADEGVHEGRVQVVGSTMLDALRRNERHARERAVWGRLGLEERAYVLVTLHRPANVDDPTILERVVEGIAAVAAQTRVVFPIHPRTRARLDAIDGAKRLRAAGVLCLPALGYVDFLSLECGAGAIVTDSGGVQEESSALGVSCYTLRAVTERTASLTHGTNVLLGSGADGIAALRPAYRPHTPSALPLADGRSGERIADAIVAHYALMTVAEAAR